MLNVVKESLQYSRFFVLLVYLFDVPEQKPASTQEVKAVKWSEFSTHVLFKTGFLRANAQKNRAKSANRGQSSKPNQPSFSVCNKVLMSL